MGILNATGDWMDVGQEMPVVDEATGRRPPYDDKGAVRPIEIVLHDGMADVQIRVDGAASSKTRRWVLATLDFLTRPQALAAMEAASWQNAFERICAACINGVRLRETGAELDEAKRRDFFENHVEWDDVLPILYTVKRGMELSRAKKKSIRLLFD